MLKQSYCTPYSTDNGPVSLLPLEYTTRRKSTHPPRQYGSLRGVCFLPSLHSTLSFRRTFQQYWFFAISRCSLPKPPPYHLPPSRIPCSDGTGSKGSCNRLIIGERTRHSH